MIAANDALERLKQGNARFAAGLGVRRSLDTRTRRETLVAGQHPIAVILGCSDSRVPVDKVFDQDLGNLFVIRVAGNIAAPSQIGSVEFAATKFGTRLVVVLGHTRCGAVRATVEELLHPSADQSPNLRAIVDKIRPAVSDLLESDSRDNLDELVEKAVNANVRQAAEDLRQGSAIIERLMHDDGLQIVGANYALETGRVEFFYTA